MIQFAVVEATFHPQRLDDLKQDAAGWIGRRHSWQAVGVVDWDSQHRGQWMMSPHPPSLGAPFAWVPLCDLADVVP